MKKCVTTIFLFAALILLSMAACAQSAEERIPGHFPERGISLPITQEDEAMGIGAAYFMGATSDIARLPILEISYSDEESVNSVLARYDQDKIYESEESFYAFLSELLACNHILYQIALYETDYVKEQMDSDGLLADALLLDHVSLLAENDGYTYVVYDTVSSYTNEDHELQARVAAAGVRARELLDTASYEPVIFGSDEVMTSPDAFPAFTTQELAGNTVTNEIFAAKDLTVVNIWGTFCNPCIDEMPELAEWSASMPENAQLIGLVSDLNSADDTETFELARAICEATGADTYISLIASEDFAGLLSCVIGVPTTLFVDRNGALVGEPVVGANVPMCRKIAEDYLNALQ